MSRRAALLLLSLALGAGACMAPEVVTPPPGVPADSTPTGPATPTTTPSNRPRDIDISGIRPCELLTPAQLVELGLDGNVRERSTSDGLYGDARSCYVNRFDTQPAVSFSLTVTDEVGIERFAEPEIVDGIRPIEIAGYPAIVSPPPPSMQDNCIVAVDVHPGQMVAVLLSDGGGNDPPLTVDQLCADAPRFAEAVMQTLLAR